MRRYQYVLHYHYYGAGKIEIINDLLVCYAPSFLDAVNQLIEHCCSRGYSSYYLDSYLETPI